MSETEQTSRSLDAGYTPFPSFEKWLAMTRVDTVRWDRYNSLLQSHSAGLPSEALERVRNVVKRAAALDTGAIEGLYEVDRGFTFTVAFEAAAWEAALEQKGEHVRPLFEAQLHAYDYVLDLATKAEPISEAAIRALHEVVCSAQPTYRVVTAVGFQEQSLPKGTYKILPNHVRTRRGDYHSYAPVDVTPAEMHRMVGELRSDAFLASHPVIQAAYSHYALVAVHPFADGNGRVSRALASAFTYRATSMPIVILSEHQNPYITSLEAADNGDYQPFVDFILSRCLDTISLVDESLRAGIVPNLNESLAGIDKLYITRGGYTHEQVDAAGLQFIQAVQKAFADISPTINRPTVSFRATIGNVGVKVSTPGYRVPLSGGRMVQLVFASTPPANAAVGRNYVLGLPNDAAGDDDVLLEASLGENKFDVFSARMEELMPTMGASLQIRINIFVERVINEMAAELQTKAQLQLKSSRS
jgi:Fic family protein